ncbi:MAG TPA: hypothetical protein VJT74_08565 [Pyrinomonadaceae bacterium]|nr:hypothetical protein [Pyrinomonadaceae bacterium]
MDSTNKAQAASQAVDILLLPFLEATTAEEEESILLRLLDEHINPVVAQILRHKLQPHPGQREGGYRSQEIEEAQHEIQLQLLKRLRQFKSRPDDKAIANLRSYVAAAARNACDEYLRRKFPQRRNLKDKVRYCLTTRPELALWEEVGKGLVSGLAEWREPARPVAEVGRHDLPASVYAALRGVAVQRLELHELIKTIFRAVGSPLGLDQLTDAVAKLQGVEDAQPIPFEAGTVPFSENLASPEASPDELIEYRQLLEQLWGEIRRLPRLQRAALLCNLKSPQGINVITLFPATGVATPRQIAEALEIPFAEFESLWGRLPLDDLSLADYLGVTRQQVINLRRSARDRLTRRRKALESEPPH